jgi:exodeoxyribonuclease VII large subunit
MLRPSLEAIRNDFAQLVLARLEKTRLSLVDFRPERIAETLRRVLQPAYQRFDDTKEMLLDAIAARLKDVRRTLENQISSLEALSPFAVLKRGYALITDQSGRNVSSAASLKAGDALSLRFHSDRAVVEVKEIIDEKL